MRTAGALLADGTHLEELIDSGRRTVSARIHVDEEIFELEQARIFARAWIPVAHTSEFRDLGDFVTRSMGRDPVVVSLSHDGEFRVMLNVCTHRGMKVCRSEVGNARTHTCAFHGWVFGSEGKLRGVPFESSIYGDRLDKELLGLRQARVGIFAGLIFATWDEDAPGLDEYIGGFGWYLEAMLHRTDAGLEVAGPPQRFVVNANWKIITEGFYGDAYHVLSVHNRSFADIGLAPAGDDSALYDFKANVNGHSALCIDLEHHGPTGEPTELLAMMPPAGMPPELLGELGHNLTSEQISMLARTPPLITALFPSSALLMIPGGPAGATASLRFFVPMSATKTEILSFTLVERDAPAEFKQQAHKTSTGTFGVGGIFECDDTEMWTTVQKGLAGVIGRTMVANYQAVGEPLDPDPTRPGTTYRGVSTDDNQWLFYERYFEFMGDRAW
jgi:phenylpropionate dioxygenase-like ring-hydroxylating dioxygenase large terminal subunit